MSENVKDVRSRLEEIDRRVMSGLTPFQRATVEYIEKIYHGNQKRVLVADEVGLGKTLIARGVISKIAKLRAEERDPLVKIAYICSNGAIAAQNIAKLAIDGEVKLSPSESSRLSMQHLMVARERGDSELKRRYIQITALTPSTSFSISVGTGTLYERALMLAVLAYDERFSVQSGRYEALADLMWAREPGFSARSWDYWKWRTNNEVAEAREADTLSNERVRYPFDILEKVEIELDASGLITFDGIAAYLDGGEHDLRYERKIVIELRKAFAKGCVDLLDPDFVIMDEFQRFHELIGTSESETSILAKRFFSGNTRVLLLSATPFRMFSTSAEIDEGGLGDSYREFLEVMGFLNEGDEVKGASFKEAWSSYVLSLQTMSLGKCDVVAIRDARADAESSVRRIMARTERQSTGELKCIADNRSHVRELKVSSADVEAYLRMREVMDNAGIPRGLMSADFVKSCPFPLSFMARYKFMDRLRAAVSKNADIVRADKRYDGGLLWLRRWDVSEYARIDVRNARYSAFMRDLCGNPGIKLEQVLWVPPSKPYYKPPQSSPFAQAAGFSKFLLFSAWSMVPPSLATLISYEFERRNVRALEAVTGNSYRYFKDEESGSDGEDRDNQALPYRRLRFDADQRNAFLLLYPSRYLSSLIDVMDLVRDELTLNDVRRLARKRIAEDLADALGVSRLPMARDATTRRTMDWYIFAAIKLDQAHGFDVMGELLQGDADTGFKVAERYEAEARVLRSICQEYAEWDPLAFDGYPVDLVQVLADAAIGSPAVCAMRCYSGIAADAPSELAFEFGHAFVNRMNTASSTLAVAAAMEERGKRSIHWKNMLAYGCEGNLQAVVDEYAHVCKPVRSELDDLEAVVRMHCSMVGGGDNPNCYLAETRHGVLAPKFGHARERIGPMLMRTNIASAFMEMHSTKKERGDRWRVRLRNAFNSPFRPFVLISTSVGQEGLDFHSYCRKICHWNLPSNPIDLEQREGRVNRYKGLAVRQSIAERYGDMVFGGGAGAIWDQLFDEAERDELERGGSEDSSGLLPYWGVTDGEQMERVERYVYLYPFSRDGVRYERLVDELIRYRAVMGMPDQEELLHALEKRVSEGAITEDDLRGLFINLCPFTWRVDDGNA